MSEVRRQMVHDDGRRAEQVVREEVGDDCAKVKITELYVEPPVKKRLAKRVIETVKPMKVGETVETYDEETGDVIEQVDSSVDAAPKMQVVSHIRSVSAQSVPETDDCAFTREAFREDMVEVLRALKGDAPVAAQAYQPQVVSAQNVIAERVSKVMGEKTRYAVWGFLCAEAVVLCYILMR